MTSSMRSLVDSVLEAIQQVVGPSSKEHSIVMHEPDSSGMEAWVYVKDCLDTGWVSIAGSWVNRFEQQLCDITSADHAVAVSNGTVVLRLAPHSVGVGPADEVLLPPLSFVAMANAVALLCVVPHFVDVVHNASGLCPVVLAARLDAIAERCEGCVVSREIGRRIAVVLLMHVFGHPVEVDQLRSVADTWALPLVEDAAEGLASWRGGSHCGLFGSVGTLSFNGNKLITTSGGGALFTNDAALAQRSRNLSTTAKQPHPWAFDHDAVGWNIRLLNLNTALGVAQLEDLDHGLEVNRLLARRYEEAFADLRGVELVAEPTHCRRNHWPVSLRFIAEDPLIAQAERLQLLKRAHSVGLLLRTIWVLLHQLPMYVMCLGGTLAVAENQAPRLFNLPSSPQLFKGWAV